MVVQIVGVRPSQFKGTQGDTVSGRNIYCIYEPEKGEGHGTERIFMTDEKLLQCGYNPRVNDVVELQYNRFGKCSAIVPISEPAAVQ